jgi:alpha-amylase
MVSAFYSSETTQMPAFPQAISQISSNCLDPTLLGTFTETHDVPRMAHYTNDLSLLRSVSTWNILYDGIPVVYQGQEQRFRGGDDPYNREAVWLSGYATDGPLYVLFKFLNSSSPIHLTDVDFRQQVIAKDSAYVTTLSQVLFTDFETVAFLKKEVLMVLSNTGQNGQKYTVTIPMKGAFQSGTEFTDIIGCGKVKVASTGDFVTTIVQGMPQVRSIHSYN